MLIVIGGDAAGMTAASLVRRLQPAAAITATIAVALHAGN